MITEQVALEQAWALIQTEGLSVARVESIRHVDASSLPPEVAQAGGYWAVVFALPEKTGEVRFPRDVVVRIFDKDKRVELRQGP